MPLPSVSVIVRAYNPNEWIFEAVNSIVGQIYNGRIEVIICYDKSSRSNEILSELKALSSKSFENRYIKVIEHERATPSQALFECGLRAASGDYVMFLDYDNVMPSNYIAEVIGQAGGFDCLCTNPMLMSESGEVLNSRLFANMPPKIDVPSLAKSNRCDINGITLSRKAVDALLKIYAETSERLRLPMYVLFEDYLIALICAKIFGIKYIENVYPLYRVHKQQLTSTLTSQDPAKIGTNLIREIATLYTAPMILNSRLEPHEKAHIGAAIVKRALFAGQLVSGGNIRILASIYSIVILAAVRKVFKKLLKLFR